MPTTKKNRHCLYCDEEIKGRADKKYCNDACRNGYNNDLKHHDKVNLVRNINNILMKNRRILKDTLKTAPTGEKIILHKDKLTQLGFSFRYITNIYTTKRDHVYYYCYDHGYMILDNDRYLIVKRNDE